MGGGAILVARRDLACQMRSPRTTLTMVLFALAVVAAFRFALGPARIGSDYAAPAVLWSAILFSGMLGLHRAFPDDGSGRGLDGLMVLPVPRTAIYLGKAIAMFVMVSLVAVLTVAFFLVFFEPPSSVDWPAFIAAAALGCWALAAAGTMVSFLTAGTRSSGALFAVLMVPLVLFPVMVPAVSVTAEAFWGGSAGAISDGLRLLLVFDVAFTAAAAVMFAFVTGERW